ncbi:hypothetical protein F4806DRAFT_159456 [Annulohypoxylon nitens]|nr:hypothetical protein F4806DRAFT_159456 [Annulohypoxylon nitens]
MPGISKKERLAQLNQALANAHNDARPTLPPVHSLPSFPPLPPTYPSLPLHPQPPPFHLLPRPPRPSPVIITWLMRDPHFPFRTPVYVKIMDDTHKLRKCEGCGNTYPWFQKPSLGVKNANIPSYICPSCAVLTPAQRADEKAPYWSAILHLWKPEVDARAAKFVVLDENSIGLLCCLHELAKYYIWQDVASMVNSMVSERLRHGPNVHWRYAVETDFYDVWETCKLLQFPPMTPDAMQPDELDRSKLAIGPFGLVVPKPGTQDPIVTTCPGGWMCANILPCLDRIVYTYAYRNRRGCDIRVVQDLSSNKNQQGGGQAGVLFGVQFGSHPVIQVNPQGYAQTSTQTGPQASEGITLNDILN